MRWRDPSDTQATGLACRRSRCFVPRRLLTLRAQDRWGCPGRRPRAPSAASGTTSRRPLVRRRQHHVRSGAIVMSPQPVRRCHAPAVAGHQAGEVELGHRGAQVVADTALVLQELRGDDRADRVAAEVLRPGGAAPVPVEAGDRVAAARLQLPPSTLRSPIPAVSCPAPVSDKEMAGRTRLLAGLRRRGRAGNPARPAGLRLRGCEVTPAPAAEMRGPASRAADAGAADLRNHVVATARSRCCRCLRTFLTAEIRSGLRSTRLRPIRVRDIYPGGDMHVHLPVRLHDSYP